MEAMFYGVFIILGGRVYGGVGGNALCVCVCVCVSGCLYLCAWSQGSPVMLWHH